MPESTDLERFSPSSLSGLCLGVWVPEGEARSHWIEPLLAESGCAVRWIEHPAALNTSEILSAPLDLLLVDASDYAEAAEELALLASARAHAPSGLRLMLAGHLRTPIERLAAIQAGAIRYLSCPVEQDDLTSALFELGCARLTRGARILLAALGEHQDSYRQALLEAGLQVIEAQDVEHLIAMQQHSPVDLVVLGDAFCDVRADELGLWLSGEAEGRGPLVLCLSQEPLEEARTASGLWMLALPLLPAHLLAVVRSCLFERRCAQDEIEGCKQALAEQVLRKRWQSLVLANTSFGVTLADARGAEPSLIEVNPGFLRLTGFREEDLLGRACPCLDAPEHEDHEAFIELRAALITGSAAQVEVRNRRQDGSLFWNQLTVLPMRDACGALTHFVGIHHDITALKEAHLIREGAADQIKSIIDSLRAMICVTEADGTIILVNVAWRQYAESLGKSPRRLSIGDNYLALCDQLTALGASDVAELGQGIRNVIAGTLDSFEARVGVSRRLVDEVQLVRIVRLSGSSPDAPRLVISHQDITSSVQIESDLRKAKEESECANQAKSEFLSLMSHELRTPMNAVLGFAQLLECDTSLNEEQQESVLEILRGGRLLLELINEMLDLSRLENGRFDLAIEPVRLADLARECIELVEPLARMREMTLGSLSAPPELANAVVRADAVRLKQVMIHLISNAIKYTQAGGRIELALLPATHVERVRLQVTDNGPGIASEQMAELFEPFSTLGVEFSGSDGHGVGLAISRRLIEAMDGQIGAISQIGEGGLFWFELPLHTAGLSGVGQADVSSGTVVPVNRALYDATPTILQIENDRSNLRLIERILIQRPGLRLLTAPSGEIGLELARSHHPELILIDADLPDMDVHEVIATLKAHSETQCIPVVCLCADPSFSAREGCRTAGCSAILAKPIDVLSLLAILDRLLAHEV